MKDCEAKIGYYAAKIKHYDSLHIYGAFVEKFLSMQENVARYCVKKHKNTKIHLLLQEKGHNT